MEKLLLTGATGFIGSHLARRLAAERYHLIILKRRSSDTKRIDDLLSKRNVTVVDVEETNINELFIREKPSAVLHLATVQTKEPKQEEVAQMLESNIALPTLLLEAMRASGCPLFINTGSFFEYRRTGKPVDEHAPLAAYNLYAATKIAFADILSYHVVRHGITAVTLRLFSPYGPGDNPRKIVPAAIRAFAAEEPFRMTKGEQRLDFVYVEDVVDAYLAVLRRSGSLRGHEIVNIGTGKATPVKEMVAGLAAAMGIKSRLELGALPYAEREIMFAQADIRKAKRLLGWRPKHSLAEGLKRTCDEELKMKEKKTARKKTRGKGGL